MDIAQAALSTAILVMLIVIWIRMKGNSRGDI
jgi:hypothetical protein